MNVFNYANTCEQMFKTYLSDQSGYKTKTTFYSDLSIAEFISGCAGVKDTYNNVVKSWFNNTEYFTEFVLALNIKSWEHFERGNNELMELYKELFYKAKDKVYNEWDLKQTDYFFRTTD